MEETPSSFSAWSFRRGADFISRPHAAREASRQPWRWTSGPTKHGSPCFEESSTPKHGRTNTVELVRFGDRSIDLRFTMRAGGDDGVYYLGSPLVAEHSPEAPIVIVYLVDTLRADHLSAYGYSRPTSPNLEAFARSATLFENCYSQATWTKPSVTSLFTGLAPDAHRAGEHGQALSTSIPTLGRLFRNAGFVAVSVIANAHAG